MCVVQHGKLHAFSDSFAPSEVDDSVESAGKLSLAVHVYFQGIGYTASKPELHSLFSSKQLIHLIKVSKISLQGIDGVWAAALSAAR